MDEKGAMSAMKRGPARPQVAGTKEEKKHPEKSQWTREKGGGCPKRSGTPLKVDGLPPPQVLPVGAIQKRRKPYPKTGVTSPLVEQGTEGKSFGQRGIRLRDLGYVSRHTNWTKELSTKKKLEPVNRLD